jgi:hypothetical protein
MMFPEPAPRMNDHDPKQEKKANPYGRSWKKVRNAKVQRNPLCELAYDGCTLFTDAVHHINHDPRFNDWSNLLSVCQHCHLIYHARDRENNAIR